MRQFQRDPLELYTRSWREFGDTIRIRAFPGIYVHLLVHPDAVEHVLQISGSASRPDEDVHLGTLTRAPVCSVSFDLVPKRRVEG